MKINKKDSASAYEDVRHVMDMALNLPGLRYECKSTAKAVNFKQRCNRYRQMLRNSNYDAISAIPGQLPSTAYDHLVVRQINEAGESDRKGTILVFDHHEIEGRLVHPETGEEIKFQKPSLFPEDNE